MGKKCKESKIMIKKRKGHEHNNQGRKRRTSGLYVKVRFAGKQFQTSIVHNTHEKN